jgi:putative transposase
VKFGFMAKHRGAWPVVMMCETLGVSRSGFYAWLNRPRSRRSQVDEVLASQVRQSFVVSDRTYGARRFWHDILALGQQCGLHRIERLMRQQALRARPRRRGLPKDRGQRSAIADNVLDRQFQADGPNQKWVRLAVSSRFNTISTGPAQAVHPARISLPCSFPPCQTSSEADSRGRAGNRSLRNSLT